MRRALIVDGALHARLVDCRDLLDLRDRIGDLGRRVVHLGHRHRVLVVRRDLQQLVLHGGLRLVQSGLPAVVIQLPKPALRAERRPSGDRISRSYLNKG